MFPPLSLAQLCRSPLQIVLSAVGPVLSVLQSGVARSVVVAVGVVVFVVVVVDPYTACY